MVVGDVIIFGRGDPVPADCVLLTTSATSGECYVITANIDGETTPKLRAVPEMSRGGLAIADLLDTGLVTVGTVALSCTTILVQG